MKWVKAAEAHSFKELEAMIADRELQKGEQVKVYFDVKVPGVAKAFDAWGAEQAFKPFIPEGMDLVDVYEEDGKGVVLMEADPAFLFAVIAFIGNHWLAIAIGGAILALVITAIVIYIKVKGNTTEFLLVIGLGIIGVVLVGYSLLKRGPPWAKIS